VLLDIPKQVIVSQSRTVEKLNKEKIIIDKTGGDKRIREVLNRHSVIIDSK